MSDNAVTVRRFYEAFLAGGFDAMSALVAEDAFWAVGGRNLLAGEYKGREKVLGLFRSMRELSGGTLRPAGTDTADIISGEYHTVLVELFRGERNGRKLNSHETWVIELHDGRVRAGFHYIFDPVGFDEFWS